MAQVAPFMSEQDWKALGVMGRMKDRAFALERPGAFDDNQYDGTGGGQQADRPYQAHLWVGGPNKVLGNPNHSSRMEPHTAANSQFFHIMTTLATPGEARLKLVREAAREANRMVKLSRELTSLDNQWTAIASSEEVAKVIRGLMDTSLAAFPADKGFESQKLPKTEAEVDFSKFARDFAKVATPGRFRSHTFTMKDGQKRSYSGLVGVIADKGGERAATDWIGSQDARLAFAPSKNAALWKAIVDSGNKTHRREMVYESSARGSKASEQVTDRSDTVVVFWNGDHRSEGFQALAYAARMGKASKVFDTAGKPLDIYEQASDAMKAHMSKAEYARSLTLDAFNLPVSSPHGRFALSLIRGPKGEIIETRDILKLAMMDKSINEIADTAAVSTGRENLLEEHRISPAALALLGDDKVMARARSSYLHVNGQLASNGVQIIGAESYPQGLVASGKMPPFLFAKGDIEKFAAAETVIGIVGDRFSDKEESRIAQNMIASRVAPALSTLSTGKALIAEVEGETSMEVPVNGPRILVIDKGHGIPVSAEIQDRRDAIIENGGVIISKLPPVDMRVFYNLETKKEEAIPSKGNDLQTQAAAGLMGAMSKTVVLTAWNGSDAQSAVRSSLSALIEKGDRPVVINFNDLPEFPEMNGNRALLSARGETALRRANFGEAFIEKHAAQLEGVRIGIDSGPDTAKAMANLTPFLKGEGDFVQKPARRQKSAAAQEI